MLTGECSGFGGESRNRQESATCPRHFAVVGLRGKAGRFVESLSPICAQTDSTKAAENLSIGDSDATPFEIRCPAGTIATGMTVRAGALIDAVGLLCDAPAPR